MKKPTTVAKPEYSSSRCWGDLPKDMIDSILGRLTLLADYDRFGAVCSTWRRASLDPINRNRRIESLLCSSSPFLLLPPPDGKSPEEKPWKLTLFDVVRGNTIVKELTSPPIPCSGKWFYGPTGGWLIFEDGKYSLILINPFYTGGGGGGGGGMIRLPQLPDGEGAGKVVLSADPALSPNDYMVFVLYNVSHKLLFIKSGDKDWGWIKTPDFYSCIYDLVFHKGLVYAVGEHNVLYVCDNFKERFQWFDLLRVDDLPTPDGLHGCFYFVQSPDDDELILVYMSEIRDLHEFHFHVYKLLLAPGGSATWHEMKNLGSDSKSIFIGTNHSVCIKSCHGGFQPNSIYFLDEEFDRGIQQVRIYNMEDGSIRRCHQRGDLAEGVDFSTPDWFFPSLPGNWKQVP